MKRTLSILVLFLASSCLLHGQDASDLETFRSFFSEQQPVPLEKSLSEASLKLEQANEIGDPKEQSEALTELGLIYLNRVPDYERAMDLFTRALAIEDSLNLQPQQVLTYVAVARVFEVVGDYFRSAQFLELALASNKDGKDINTVAMILNALGKINASRGQLDEALGNYQQVLRYRDDIDKQFEAEALFNLGHLYTLQAHYSEALDHHKKALAIVRREGDRHAEARSLNDIGVLYGLMQNDDKSLANHLVALEIRQSLNDQNGIAESYNNIGLLYFRQEKWNEAIGHANLALKNGQEAQAQEQIFKSYELLSQAYKHLGEYRHALGYKELSLAINELVQSEKHERELLETQNRYVVAKKESEIQKLETLRLERERELAAQKKFRNILFLVAVLIFITAGLLLILYLVKRRSNRVLLVAKKEVQRQNDKLQELIGTKDKFFSIISHDLKGPLNSLTSFSRLLIDHTDSMSKEEIRLLAKDLDKSVKNLLTLLENLLEWSRSQTGNIDFSPEEFDLAEILDTNKTLLQSQAADKQLEIITEHSGPLTVRLHKQSVNTVIRNLISNAIKFSNPGGTIRAGITRDNARLNVFIADTGVGMTREVMDKIFRLDSKHSTRGTANEKGTGLGLILCREFIEKNGGTIRVESAPGKGSVFTCSFPLAVLSRPATVKTSAVSF